MFWCTIFFYLFAYIFNRVYGQTCTTAGVLNGQYYYCLPSNVTCPTGSATIDPRIVTPSSTPLIVCGAGTQACFGNPNIGCGLTFTNRTSSDQYTASFGAYPWQAVLQYQTLFAGSGVLVSEYIVLTAAHKVYGYRNNLNNLLVLMGVWDLNTLINVQRSTVMNISIPDNFNNTTLKNDIAVLRLNCPIVIGIFNNINKICLPASGTSFVNTNCVVSGWGQPSFENKNLTNPPKQVNVTITDYAQCRMGFINYGGLPTVDMYLDANGEICAGGEAMKDACTQDGGSPLVCPSSGPTFTVAGLVIWGKNCGRAGVYGVYVNVAYYRNWFQQFL